MSHLNQHLDGLNTTVGEGARTSPTHVAVIMDGNGRWAGGRDLPRIDGHRAGTDNIRRVIEAFAQRGVKFLTLFAFSTENWDRPSDEVQGLIEILREMIDREVERLHSKGVRVRHLGRLDRLPSEIQRSIQNSEELTKHNTGMTLSVAFNYGGRTEILDAIRNIVADGVGPEEITDDLFRSYLYISEIPDPDLIIRTAGEMRLSNFLLWQSAYAEYFTTNVLWPDFDEVHVEQAITAYSQRQRRFGKISSHDPNSSAG